MDGILKSPSNQYLIMKGRTKGEPKFGYTINSFIQFLYNM